MKMSTEDQYFILKKELAALLFDDEATKEEFKQKKSNLIQFLDIISQFIPHSLQKCITLHLHPCGSRTNHRTSGCMGILTFNLVAHILVTSKQLISIVDSGSVLYEIQVHLNCCIFNYRNVLFRNPLYFHSHRHMTYRAFCL